jgi:hypothetical protein
VICPRCEGQRFDVGSCALCGNVGHLDEEGNRIESLADIRDAYVADPTFKSSVDEALGVMSRTVRLDRSRGAD